MKILVSGSSGLVGSALVEALKDKGHEVLRLVRKEVSKKGEVFWDPLKGEVEVEKIDGVDVVVNLAGENVAAGRWSSKRKKQIRESRVQGTRTLVTALKSLDHPPKLLINASAIGFYGDTGADAADEDSSSGEGFLASVCKEWEEAADEAERNGVRVVKLRIGVVITPKGGALKRMLLPFKLGLGGRVGSGEQFMSWISIDDLVSMIVYIIDKQDIAGAVNAVSPTPITNNVFTEALGKALARPTLFPLPAFMVRILFGEMGEELLLKNSKILPQKIMQSGFHFRHPKIESVLVDYL